jgi:hypothetical protein
MDEDEALAFRWQLKAARHTALRDGEQFHDLICAMERLGRRLALGAAGEHRGFGDAAPQLRAFLVERLEEDGEAFVTTIEQLMEMVRTARNDALHQGAFARHLTRNATLLAIQLEDALMVATMEVRHFMVANPVTAALWQTVEMVRQAMLVDSRPPDIPAG